MAHYAFIDEGNIVTLVIVGRDEDDAVEGVSDWETFYSNKIGQECFRTSYNTSGGVHYTDGEPSADQSRALRFNYAGIGYTYDQARDAFVPPAFYPSWILNNDTCLWDAPVPYPADGSEYVWDEETISWVLMDVEE
jgi:hypothetical protein